MTTTSTQQNKAGKIRDLIDLCKAMGWKVEPSSGYWELTDQEGHKAALICKNEKFSIQPVPLKGDFEGLDEESRFDNWLADNDIE